MSTRIYLVTDTETNNHRLIRAGNQWCALYGDDLQSGVAGFGSSPQEAMFDFDLAWREKLTPSNACDMQMATSPGRQSWKVVI